MLVYGKVAIIEVFDVITCEWRNINSGLAQTMDMITYIS